MKILKMIVTPIIIYQSMLLSFCYCCVDIAYCPLLNVECGRY